MCVVLSLRWNIMPMMFLLRELSQIYLYGRWTSLLPDFTHFHNVWWSRRHIFPTSLFDMMALLEDGTTPTDHKILNYRQVDIRNSILFVILITSIYITLYLFRLVLGVLDTTIRHKKLLYILEHFTYIYWCTCAHIIVTVIYTFLHIL